MIKVSNELEAILINSLSGLNNDNVSMKKNSAQYISDIENTYFRYTDIPSERNDG